MRICLSRKAEGGNSGGLDLCPFGFEFFPRGKAAKLTLIAIIAQAFCMRPGADFVLNKYL